MSAYRQLLDATIAHLERLDELGVVTVPVQAESLRRLSQPSVPSLGSSVARSPAPSAKPVRFDPTPRESFVAAPVLTEPILSPVGSSSVSQPLRTKLPPAAKAQAFAALKEKALQCVQCSHLVAKRHTVVFGEGDPDARILFVGEAPGADEDLAGQPFVGLSGDLLTKIITAMGLSRDRVYIANILKCRPDMPAGVTGNRKPRPDEMATCLPWLHEQIDLIQPEVMIALGGTAVEGLIGGPVMITRLRGKWQSYRGIPLMPTYHPAYLLRNEVVAEKRRVWEDMLAVMERIKMPISARQREFFTKT